MSQHTPGPWTAHDDYGTGTLPCVLSDTVNTGGNFYVAQCNVFADARLIAAAPEMLTVASALLAKLDTITTEEFSRGEEKTEREALRAAIRKAEEG